MLYSLGAVLPHPHCAQLCPGPRLILGRWQGLPPSKRHECQGHQAFVHCHTVLQGDPAAPVSARHLPGGLEVPVALHPGVGRTCRGSGAVACVDDAADAPRLALAAGSHAPPPPGRRPSGRITVRWQVFRDACEGEGAPGTWPRWEDMCRKEFPDCIYTAQRRTRLHCGRTEYRSTTVLRDAGAEAVMDFTWMTMCARCGTP